MSANISSACTCNSVPCVCSCACPPPGEGCVSEFCAPRPCFFDGQLITSDDLNAMITYFRTRDAMFAKLVAGWGVSGGMRLAPPGAKSLSLFSSLGLPASIFPNPQIFAGSAVRVTAGAGFDNAGRALAVCSDTVLDITRLTKGVPAYTFPFPIPGDSYPTTVNLPGWFIVAEYEESAARPVPQFSTGGPCDPAPTCNFSRRLEQVRFRALTDLPLLYFVHGCLDPVPLPGLDELVAGLDGGSETPMIESLGSMGAMALMPTLSTPTGSSTGGMNFYANEITDCFLSMLVPQVFDYLNGVALSVCCARPGLALGIVLQVTLGDLPEDVAAVVVSALGTHPVYTLVLDGFPYRRLIGNSANNLTLIQIVLSALVCSGGGGGAPA